MVRRGLGEALAAVALERRQAAMLRSLSSLLADASLAVHGRASLAEVLQLVAEQARELTEAIWCVAHADLGRSDATTVASDASERLALAGAAEEAFAAVREQPASGDVVYLEAAPAPGELIAAPLSALDGRAIGVLAIAGRRDRRFSELEKALLVHLAQMTAAALERASRYPALLPGPNN
jgi:hypothetical protein